MIQTNRVDISLALATRNRVKELARFFNSITTTADDLARIEVLLGVDFDDPSLAEIVKLANAQRFDVIVMARKRSANLSHDYLNRCFAMARGHWLWVMNDDVEIVTPGWDSKIMGAIDDRRPAYLDTFDSTRNYRGNGEFACFPIMNRRAFHALGYFFHPQVPTWGADKLIHQIFTEAGFVQQLFEVEVRHEMSLQDEQHENMKAQAERYGCGGDIDITDDVKRLRSNKCSAF